MAYPATKRLLIHVFHVIIESTFKSFWKATRLCYSEGSETQDLWLSPFALIAGLTDRAAVALAAGLPGATQTQAPQPTPF